MTPRSLLKRGTQIPKKKKKREKKEKLKQPPLSMDWMPQTLRTEVT